jgi:cell volume regulation protein A
MAGPFDALLAALGAIIVAGFVSAVAFRRFRVPDVLVLIGFGVLLGPVTGVLDPAAFGTVTAFVATFAILIVLFDGGLEITLKELHSGVAKGTILAFVVFGLTAFMCAGVAYGLGGLSPANSLLLGMAFGGAGVVIVIPLIRHLGVSRTAVTVVTIEAAVSDVLVVLGVYGMATAISIRQTDPLNVAETVVATFAVGCLTGAVAGFAWARILRTAPLRGFEYMLTLGIVLLLYAATEYLRGSGPIAVLVFGIILGNTRRLARPWSDAEEAHEAAAPGGPESVFGGVLRDFHHEMVFLVRSVFFVLLGVVLDPGALRDPRLLLLGTGLAVAVGLARWIGVRLLLTEKTFDVFDRRAVAAMFPLGLAAAALSVVPSQRFGIPGTEEFGTIAAIVILLTNAFSGILTFVLGRLQPPVSATA